MRESTRRQLTFATIVLGIIGFADALYLTAKFYAQSSVFCSLLNNGCDLVTTSRYASFGGIPIALGGAVYYALIVVLALSLWRGSSNKILNFLIWITVAGFLFSMWLLYLQIFVIKALCAYCLVSAATSMLVFIISLVYSLKNNTNEQNTKNIFVSR